MKIIQKIFLLATYLYCSFCYFWEFHNTNLDNVLSLQFFLFLQPFILITAGIGGWGFAEYARDIFGGDDVDVAIFVLTYIIGFLIMICMASGISIIQYVLIAWFLIADFWNIAFSEERLIIKFAVIRSFVCLAIFGLLYLLFSNIEYALPTNDLLYRESPEMSLNVYFFWGGFYFLIVGIIDFLFFEHVLKKNRD